MSEPIPTECPSCGSQFFAETFESEICKITVKIKQRLCEGCIEAKEESLKNLSTPDKPKDRKLFIPASYQDFDSAKLPTDRIRTISTRVFSWQKSSKGIGLMGESFAGKTFIIFELMRRWNDAGESVKAISSTMFAACCGSIETGVRLKMLNQCKVADLLFIDDLGKEKLTERVRTDLYDVLESRRRNKKPLFVTTNSDGETLKAKLSTDDGPAIVNRIKESCGIIGVD